MEDVWISQAPNRYIIGPDHADYPPLLRHIYAPPQRLYVWGNIHLLQQSQLAIVGTRHPTVSGRQAAFTYAQQLTEYGLLITSGLAIGIDTLAHQGALSKGNTIAVLGSGLDWIYPKSNRKLAEQIIHNGCLISEFTPNSPPKPHHFPQRNRIISGLALGVLVIEATLNSGSLITARLGLEQNREIFALPGNTFNPQSKGCHQLIKQGATLVDSTNDIMETLSLTRSLSPAQPKEVGTQGCFQKQRVLNTISYELTTIDEIIASTQLAFDVISIFLSELETEEKILSTPGGFIKAHVNPG